MSRTDLREVIKKTKRYNLHTHTQFCDGHSTMEAIARSAVASGFEVLGFTPHSPVDIESPCNMSATSVPLYMAEVAQLDAELPLTILAGMEIDYLGPGRGPAAEYYQSLGLDYSIGSVHFIPSQQGVLTDIDGSPERFSRYVREVFDGDIDYVIDTFYKQSHAMLDEGGFDILGHFDKVAHNASVYQPGIEDTPRYRKIIADYIDHIIASGVLVEINTKAYQSAGRFFPELRYWKHLVEASVLMPVNSDAHYDNRLTAGRDSAYEELKKAGYAYC